MAIFSIILFTFFVATFSVIAARLGLGFALSVFSDQAPPRAHGTGHSSRRSLA